MAFLGTEGELTRFGDVARVSDWVVARRARPVPPALAGARRPARACHAVPSGGRRTARPHDAPAAHAAPRPRDERDGRIRIAPVEQTARGAVRRVAEDGPGWRHSARRVPQAVRSAHICPSRRARSC